MRMMLNVMSNQEAIIEAPYNALKNRCEKHPRGKNQGAHFMKTVAKGPIIDGAQENKEACKYCGGVYYAKIDHRALSHVFAA